MNWKKNICGFCKSLFNKESLLSWEISLNTIKKETREDANLIQRERRSLLWVAVERLAENKCCLASVSHVLFRRGGSLTNSIPAPLEGKGEGRCPSVFLIPMKAASKSIVLKPSCIHRALFLRDCLC